MNAPAWLHPLFEILDRHELLGRLFFASVEFAALALVVGLCIFVLRLRQPRLRVLLWLVVLAKPLAGLALGTPLPLLALKWSAPAPLVFQNESLILQNPTLSIPSMPSISSMSSISSLPSTPSILLSVWFLGVLLSTLRLLIGRLRLARIIRHAALTICLVLAFSIIGQARAIEYQALRLELKRQGKPAPEVLFEDLEIEPIWPGPVNSGQKVTDPFGKFTGTTIRITRNARDGSPAVSLSMLSGSKRKPEIKVLDQPKK